MTLQPLHENAPLALSEISKRLSPKTLRWLQDADEKAAELETEIQGETADSVALFNLSDDEEDELVYRIQEWCSSLTKPDGIGGYANCEEEEDGEETENGAMRVKYILSDAGGGHGDDLWAASRHISNIFVNEEKCRNVLSPLLSSKSVDVKDNDNSRHGHPLLGMRFMELGAGAGLPSWSAMKCGAEVVCTDQAIANRIRCMAECAERNLREMRKEYGEEDETLIHAEKALACPYDWGSPIDDVINVPNGVSHENKECLFDVIVAADCIYMPHFHSLLLDSIKLFMSPCGLALLPFALHGNTNDNDIWSIVDLAKEKGFNVDVLESQQLTPQSEHMDLKRALVHTLRLTWR